MATDDTRKECPYSAETIAGCRYYEPRSHHASAPGSELCRHVVVEQRGTPVRRLRCVREMDLVGSEQERTFAG
jgi:hypothetical protein